MNDNPVASVGSNMICEKISHRVTALTKCKSGKILPIAVRHHAISARFDNRALSFDKPGHRVVGLLTELIRKLVQVNPNRF